jgi:hypothetical protein
VRYNLQEHEARKAAKWADNRPVLKELLATKLKGRFIEVDETHQMMADAQWRYASDRLMINLDGKWLGLARVDLCGEAPTTRANPNAEWWKAQARYGAVVTADNLYVVDAWSDG